MKEINNFINNNKKLILNTIFMLSIVLGVYLFFTYIFRFISPFVFGWLLSLIFVPFVGFLQNKLKIPRWIGSIFSILLLLSFFSIFVVGISSRLTSEAVELYNKFPTYLENLYSSIAELNTKIDETFDIMPLAIQNLITQSNANLLNILTSLIKTSGSRASFNFVFAIPNSFVVVIITLMSSYFFTKDEPVIKAFILRHLPESTANSYKRLKTDLLEALFGYLKAQLILMIFTFIICIIGFLILHSPYTLLLAVITSIIDALPFFGSGFILWPAAVIQLLWGNTVLAVGYIIIYLVVTLVRQIMQPKILSTQIGLHPLVTLISMFIGLKAMGVMGMIFGPILAVLLITIQEIRLHPDKVKTKPLRPVKINNTVKKK